MRRLAKLLGIVATLLLALPAQANETLTYDANGNVQSRSLPGGTTQYGYDDLERLSSEAGPAKTQNLTYDANDNRLSDGSGSKTYTANTNKLATANGQTVTLDKVGNITQIRGLSLDWNQSGQLKSVTQGRTQLATYFYDYKGRRSRKVTPTETTIYIYDLWDHLLGEFNGTGAPLRTYIWRDDIPVAIILHGTPEKVLYLETDHLNTPIAARDENAKLVWKWESDAFGSTLPNEDPDVGGQKTTINLRFPGQFYDKESGFHYNHHRYYDPQTGRYLSPDPIGLAGGRNSFGYVGGNPLSNVDPEGLAYYCTQPLHNMPLGDLGGLGPLHHGFTCSDNGVCGGQDRQGNPILSKGKKSSGDDLNRALKANRCEKIDTDQCTNDCIEQEVNSSRRPDYTVIPGVLDANGNGRIYAGISARLRGEVGPPMNCQDWAKATILFCQVRCQNQ